MRSDLDGARAEEVMRRYLTPAQISELGRLFAVCVVEIAERRAARLAAQAADVVDSDVMPTKSAARG